MFKQLDIYWRLIACLLVSAGAHAMLGLSGMRESDLSSRASGPVEIALVSAKQQKTTAFQTVRQPVSPGQAERPRRQPAARELPVVATPRAAPDTQPVATAVDPVSSKSMHRSEPQDEQTVRGAKMVTDEPQAASATTLDSEVEVSRLRSSAVVATEPFTDAVPAYLSNPIPDYPRLARRRSWQGVVWLLVDVSSTGEVADLAVEQSSGYRILDRAASETVRSWTFVPARSGGLAVASQVRVPVEFVLEGS